MARILIEVITKDDEGATAEEDFNDLRDGIVEPVMTGPTVLLVLDRSEWLRTGIPTEDKEGS